MRSRRSHRTTVLACQPRRRTGRLIEKEISGSRRNVAISESVKFMLFTSFRISPRTHIGCAQVLPHRRPEWFCGER